MDIDQELRLNWRKHWLGSIQEFADYKTQHRMWLDTANTNPHFSFVEYFCSYFDGLVLSDEGYTSMLERGLINENEVAAVADFHKLVDKYESPTDDYDHNAILSDPAWSEVVAAAQQAQRKLLILIDDPLERSILVQP